MSFARLRSITETADMRAARSYAVSYDAPTVR